MCFWSNPDHLYHHHYQDLEHDDDLQASRGSNIKGKSCSREYFHPRLLSSLSSLSLSSLSSWSLLSSLSLLSPQLQFSFHDHGTHHHMIMVLIIPIFIMKSIYYQWLCIMIIILFIIIVEILRSFTNCFSGIVDIFASNISWIGEDMLNGLSYVTEVLFIRWFVFWVLNISVQRYLY